VADPAGDICLGTVLMMKEVPMQTVADERYGLNEQLKEKSTEESNIASYDANEVGSKQIRRIQFLGSY